MLLGNRPGTAEHARPSGPDELQAAWCVENTPTRGPSSFRIIDLILPCICPPSKRSVLLISVLTSSRPAAGTFRGAGHAIAWPSQSQTWQARRQATAASSHAASQLPPSHRRSLAFSRWPLAGAIFHSRHLSDVSLDPYTLPQVWSTYVR